MESTDFQVARDSRRPLYFGRPDRPLFGFFHPPVGQAREVAVVLCSPLGTDQSRSARTYRHLAEQLAAAGFACLRFDLYGTGDSGGDERVPELTRAWVEDVGIASAELRALSGAKGIALVGLRFGGTIALSYAADQSPVDSLVLWDSCVSGVAFLGEITKLHKIYLRMQPQLGSAPPPATEGEEALGDFFPRALVDDISRIDLLRISHRPARRVLLIEGGHFPQRETLAARLDTLGATPELRSHPDHKFLTTVSQGARVPQEIIASIVGWLSEGHGLGQTPAIVPEDRTARPSPASERALIFGGQRSLFGILTPADPAKASLGFPPIIITNAGCVNRVGPHRISVRMARRWAQLGFDVLRLDLSGLGDSLPERGAEENLTYPPSALADLEEAIIALGSRPAIIAGLCSGDYAFQMGAHSPNVAGAWLLNPRTFCVLDLVAVEAGDGQAPATTPVAEVPAMLRRMAERGLDTVLLVSRSDPGVAFVDAHAGEQMRGLSELAAFHRFDVEFADHTFTLVSTQQRISDLLTEHLLDRT